MMVSAASAEAVEYTGLTPIDHQTKNLVESKKANILYGCASQAPY